MNKQYITHLYGQIIAIDLLMSHFYFIFIETKIPLQY